jgi:hypothetical protein
MKMNIKCMGDKKNKKKNEEDGRCGKEQGEELRCGKEQREYPS